MKLFLLTLLTGLIFKMNNAQSPQVHYKLAMPDPSSHYFKVEISFKGLPNSDNYIDLKLPVWRPGRYFVFDFASGVQEFTPTGAAGSDLKFYKTDKSTWRVETGSNSKIRVNYKVYANDFASRTRGLDESHAFVNCAAVFMYSEKYRYNPLILKVLPFADWHVTTGLDNTGSDPNEFSAPGYDHFADCPLEIGTQTDFEFMVDGKKHVISFYGEANYTRDTLINDFTKIIRKNYEFWRSVPYKKYYFIVHCTPQSGGGTEHVNSTVVGVKPSAFDTPGGYESFLRLISHEFFHTWNVKQLKPKGLTPYDYSKEHYTSELWIAEGGTSYYDGLMLVRTHQMAVDEFYNEITRGAAEERRRPGNKIQSVSESSFDAWVKFWRRNPNAYESESDYYSKGSYVSLILDLEIRNLSKNKHSLDDVFREMYETFPLDKKGYTNEDFMKSCEGFAGTSLKGFFDDYVYGTKPIEWEKYLGFAGLELKTSRDTVVPIVGLKTSKKDDKIIVDEVIDSSSAKSAGMTEGDEIIAYNGERLSYEDMEKRIKELIAGDKVSISVFRNNKL